MRYGTNSPKPKPTEKQSTSQALLHVRGVWSGSSVSWDVLPVAPKVQTNLTPEEINALQRKHESRNLNLERITEVKRMMQQGKNQLQIIHALRGRKGCGERQIKKDMAALSQR